MEHLFKKHKISIEYYHPMEKPSLEDCYMTVQFIRLSDNQVIHQYLEEPSIDIMRVMHRAKVKLSKLLKSTV